MIRPIALGPVALSLLAAGCGRPAPAPAPPKPTAVATAGAVPEAPASYRVVGLVRRVDPKAGLLTIRHEAIPGFMPAMTMPFEVKDRGTLDDLVPGDEVVGRLLVAGDDSELVDVEVTRAAPPDAAALDFSGATPQLKDVPRVLKPGDPVPDFAFTTQEATELSLSALRGDVVVLTFIYTRCPIPEFCPAMDRTFAELAGRLAATPSRSASVRLISLSFDPEHDTPAVLLEHAKARGAKPPLWTFAVASHEELRKVAGPLGLSYGPNGDEIIHNRCIAVIGPDGRLARLDLGEAGRIRDVGDLLGTIRRLIPPAPGRSAEARAGSK